MQIAPTAGPLPARAPQTREVRRVAPVAPTYHDPRHPSGGMSASTLEGEYLRGHTGAGRTPPGAAPPPIAGVSAHAAHAVSVYLAVAGTTQATVRRPLVDQRA